MRWTWTSESLLVHVTESEGTTVPRFRTRVTFLVSSRETCNSEGISLQRRRHFIGGRGNFSGRRRHVKHNTAMFAFGSRRDWMDLRLRLAIVASPTGMCCCFSFVMGKHIHNFFHNTDTRLLESAAMMIRSPRRLDPPLGKHVT